MTNKRFIILLALLVLHSLDASDVFLFITTTSIIILSITVHLYYISAHCLSCLAVIVSLFFQCCCFLLLPIHFIIIIVVIIFPFSYPFCFFNTSKRCGFNL